MNLKDEQNVVPSHGYTVDNTREYVPPKADQPAAPAGDQKPGDQQPAADQKPADQQPAGDQKPGEQQPAADQQSAGDQKPGEQQPAADQQAAPGNDILSSMQQTLAQITQQLSQQPAGQQPAGQPQQDPGEILSQQLAEIQQMATNGEITYEEMLAQTAPIIKQQAVLEVQKQLQADAEQRQVQDAQGQFLQQYPEFQQFVQSPEAQAIVQSNPVFDHVSAFFATREAKMAEENKQLAAQVQALTQQVQNSIKTAATTQSTVVGGQNGESVGVPTTFRGDGLDAQKGGMAALSRARQQVQ